MLIDTYYPGTLTEVKGEKRKGVLMTVRGPFGKTEATNKNDRVYTNSLWERVIKTPEIQQKLKDRAIFGEPDHPQTLYPSISRASHIVTKLELDKNSNVLIGEADIIDTPSGRIVKAIYDAGGKLGISSRGAGGVKQMEGKTIVDEEDYKFGGFDFVFEPSNDNAYPVKVESLNQELKNLMLTEGVSEDREYYQNLIGKISANLTEKKKEKEEIKTSNKKTVIEEPKSPSNLNLEHYTKMLQEKDKRIAFLEKQLESLGKAYKQARDLSTSKSLEVMKSAPKEEFSESFRVIETGLRSQIEALNETLSLQNSEIDSLRNSLTHSRKGISQTKEKVEILESRTLTDFAEYNQLKKDLQRAKSQLLEEQAYAKSLKKKSEALKETGESSDRDIERVKKQNISLLKENLKLYALYQASENSIDSRSLLKALPENFTKEDVNRTVEVFTNSGKYQRQKEGLPNFDLAEKPLIPVIVESKQSKGIADTNGKRVIDMIKKM